MQHILSEEELNHGCQIVESWRINDLDLEQVYIEQENLNKQGYFTVINNQNGLADVFELIVHRRD